MLNIKSSILEKGLSLSVKTFINSTCKAQMEQSNYVSLIDDV